MVQFYDYDLHKGWEILVRPWELQIMSSFVGAMRTLMIFQEFLQWPWIGIPQVGMLLLDFVVLISVRQGLFDILDSKYKTYCDFL